MQEKHKIVGQTANLIAQAKSEIKSGFTLAVQVMEAYLEFKGNGKQN